jgi:hypothetical protein
MLFKFNAHYRYVDVNPLQTYYSLFVTLVRPTFGRSHCECNVAPTIRYLLPWSDLPLEGAIVSVMLLLPSTPMVSAFVYI